MKLSISSSEGLMNMFLTKCGERAATPPTGAPGCQIQPNGETMAIPLPAGSYTVTALLESQVS
ncbi:MAG: hypothetical protein R6X03_00760, partial [Methyloceanibacter sp.]